ncbi:SgcJ/EcaC family oxidoreductase [Streptomyces sp. 5K101]|uniref:SgcJ/EcaC family oxidoreductase n=1 Tax=Streptomyces sp. 5K101 TaxID=3390037 RepID=UPI0039762CF3
MRSWARGEAAAALGSDFADALALDQSVSGDAARKQLGCNPSRPGAVDDLRNGSYRTFEVFGAQGDVRQDVDAIVRLVAEVERAQQSELADAFMSLFRTQDPVWTTAHGMRLSGWDEISSFTHKVLPGAMAHSTASYDVERVLFVRPRRGRGQRAAAALSVTTAARSTTSPRAGRSTSWRRTTAYGASRRHRTPQVIPAG